MVSGFSRAKFKLWVRFVMSSIRDGLEVSKELCWCVGADGPRNILIMDVKYSVRLISNILLMLTLPKTDGFQPWGSVKHFEGVRRLSVLGIVNENSRG